jgi:hypothetical protein
MNSMQNAATKQLRTFRIAQQNTVKIAEAAERSEKLSDQ